MEKEVEKEEIKENVEEQKTEEVKVNRMALSISLALGFIPDLYEQADKILKSQASRGRISWKIE